MSKIKNILKLGRIANIYNGSTPDTRNSLNWDGIVPWITPADLKGDKYVAYGKRNITEIGVKNTNLVALPKNTVLLTSRAPIGKVAIAKNTLYTNQGFKNIVLDDSTMLPEFLYYYLLISEEKLNILGKGTTFKEISKNDVANLRVPCPDISVQKKVIEKLNVLVKEINSIVIDTKQSIDELQKYKKSIITEVVTKGLDANVEVKESRIEWASRIPKNWKEVRLKSLFQIIDNRNLDENAQLLSLFTSIGVKPRSEMEERGNKAQTVINYKEVKKGDLIVNKLLAWMGAIGYSDYNGVTSPDYDVYRSRDNISVERRYYNYYFRHTPFKSDCYKVGRGIMMMRWRTYPEQFLNIVVTQPSLEEQIEIADYLDNKVKKIDKLIADKSNIINELERYKKSLIYEYVTGKKEV